MATRSRKESLILVSVSEDTRGLFSRKKVSVEDLSAQVKEFVQQIDSVLRSVGDLSSGFALAEVEISAEVTAKGSVSLLGTGGEAGATGGLKFLFRKA